MTNSTVESSPQRYARLAGVLLLITFIAGGFGELYAPAKLIVSADPAATVNNVRALDWVYRLGFAGYLVEAVCDVTLTWLLYALLRPVNKDIALLAAFFRIVSTATFAIAEFFYFAVSLILGGASYLKVFSPEQLNALAMLSFKFFGYGGEIFMVFYGIASILHGYLIFRSGYLPRFLGVLLALGGVGFVFNNFTLVLAPAYASDFFPLPMALAVLSLIFWLIVKGVDRPIWEKKVGTA